MGRNLYPTLIQPRFLTALNKLTHKHGVRGLAAITGISKATISRAQRGFVVDLASAQQLGTVAKVCPCCGRGWRPKPTPSEH